MPVERAHRTSARTSSSIRRNRDCDGIARAIPAASEYNTPGRRHPDERSRGTPCGRSNGVCTVTQYEARVGDKRLRPCPSSTMSSENRFTTSSDDRAVPATASLIKLDTAVPGHEWDEWDGAPLANGGDFRTTAPRYFLFTASASRFALGSVRCSSAAGAAARAGRAVASLGLYATLGAAGLLAAVGWRSSHLVRNEPRVLPDAARRTGPLLATFDLACRTGELFALRATGPQRGGESVRPPRLGARSEGVGERSSHPRPALPLAHRSMGFEIAKRYDVAAFVEPAPAPPARDS